MSQITISIPARLRHYLDGERLISVEATTPVQALEALVTRSVELRESLFEPSGEMRKFARIAVNGELLDPNEGLDDPIPAGSHLVIVLAITGG